VISLEGVSARRSPLALSNITVGWGSGVHAVVGGPDDGGALLLALVSGAARPRGGRVRVLDGAPTDRSVRARVAFISLETELPAAMRVDEVLALAEAIRGEPPRDARDRLRTLGIEALASRRTGTLSGEETRAVAMAEATTSARVVVLLVSEPLVKVDARAAAALPGVFRERAREGLAVVVATASVRDASDLADDCTFLRHGAVVGRTSSLIELAGHSPRGARLRIVASDPRALASALAREVGVQAVARSDGAVVARGEDALELARSAGRAIVASGVDVVEMRIEPPPLDEARSAAAGIAAAGRGGPAS
jgi:ABC-type multidrug transport system ATPase subunit